jgi:hypothetical protein
MESTHTTCRENLQENKVSLDPILSQGPHLDTLCPSVLLTPSLPQGQDKNHGNKEPVARQCNIPDPLSFSISEVLICLDACKNKCTFYQEHGQHFSQKHLNNWLMITKEQNNEGAFKKLAH